MTTKEMIMRSKLIDKQGQLDAAKGHLDFVIHNNKVNLDWATAKVKRQEAERDMAKRMLDAVLEYEGEKED